MATALARGWTADWVVAYLAAIGVTRLVPGAQLAWTEASSPVAVISTLEDRPVAAEIADAIPSAQDIEALSIARNYQGSVELPRTVSVAAFRDRARLARATMDGTLEATVTDLSSKPGEKTEHGPFDPSVPQGLTLHQRLVSIRAALPEEVPAEIVEVSMAGRARRVKRNGLGFDVRRIDASIQADTDKWIDPVTELFAFFGVLMFPVRGKPPAFSRQRGWTGGALGRGAFSWPAWSVGLDWWGIDALLDRFYEAGPPEKQRKWKRRTLALLGIHAAFGSVSYQPRGSADATRGIGSERLRW